MPPEGLAPTREAFIDKVKPYTDPISLDELTEILGTTIKHDDNNKVVTFLTMLLTYTEEDQINLAILGESSAGKSYIPLELVKHYFPAEDVVKLGHVSPKALFHDNDPKITVWENDPTDTRDLPEDKKRHIKHVNLERKMLIFVDQPHPQVIMNLRSFMSHDDKHLIYKIADKKGSGQIQTKSFILDGFATVIYCSASQGSMQDQELTRLLVLSPEVTSDKILESITYGIETRGNTKAHKKFLSENPGIARLVGRVSSIKQARINNVIIPPELQNVIDTRFKEKRIKHLAPRFMRDIHRLIGLINAWTLFNHYRRERVDGDLIATEEDVLMGFQLYADVGEANEFGLSPEVYDIYKKLEPYLAEVNVQDPTRFYSNVDIQGKTRRDIQEWFRQSYGRPIGRERIAQILSSLEKSGLVSEEKNGGKYWYRLVSPVGGVVGELPSNESGIPPPPSTQGRSIMDVLTRLKQELPNSFIQQAAFDIIVLARQCDPAEAERLFDKFVNQGILFRTVDGLWRWT